MPHSRPLDGLIFTYCHNSVSKESAERNLVNLKNELASIVAKNPRQLLEPSGNGTSYISDMLHIPFERTVARRHDYSIRIAADGLDALLSAYHDAIDKGKITEKEYGKVLTTPSENLPLLHEAIMSGSTLLYDKVASELALLQGVINDESYVSQFAPAIRKGGRVTRSFSPLYDVVTSGNVELYDKISKELSRLHRLSKFGISKTNNDERYASQYTRLTKHDFTLLHNAVGTENMDMYLRVSADLAELHKNGLLSDEKYAGQFTTPDMNGITPLQSAVSSGNVSLFDKVLDDMVKILDEEVIRQQLLHRSTTGWNLFVSATKPNKEKGTPNTELIDHLIDAYYEHFNDGRVRQHLEKLLSEKTQEGMVAYHSGQPKEIQERLSLDPNSPLRPSR